MKSLPSRLACILEQDADDIEAPTNLVPNHLNEHNACPFRRYCDPNSAANQPSSSAHFDTHRCAQRRLSPRLIWLLRLRLLAIFASIETALIVMLAASREVRLMVGCSACAIVAIIALVLAVKLVLGVTGTEQQCKKTIAEKEAAVERLDNKEKKQTEGEDKDLDLEAGTIWARMAMSESMRQKDVKPEEEDQGKETMIHSTGDAGCEHRFPRRRSESENEGDRSQSMTLASPTQTPSFIASHDQEIAEPDAQEPCSRDGNAQLGWTGSLAHEKIARHNSHDTIQGEPSWQNKYPEATDHYQHRATPSNPGPRRDPKNASSAALQNQTSNSSPRTQALAQNPQYITIPGSAKPSPQMVQPKTSNTEGNSRRQKSHSSRSRHPTIGNPNPSAILNTSHQHRRSRSRGRSIRSRARHRLNYLNILPMIAETLEDSYKSIEPSSQEFDDSRAAPVEALATLLDQPFPFELEAQLPTTIETGLVEEDQERRVRELEEDILKQDALILRARADDERKRLRGALAGDDTEDTESHGSETSAEVVDAVRVSGKEQANVENSLAGEQVEYPISRRVLMGDLEVLFRNSVSS